MGEVVTTGVSPTLYPSRNPSDRPGRWPFISLVLGMRGFEYRRDQVALNLLDRGIASVLPMIPYYGYRRPRDQDRWYVNSVADFLLQLTVGFMESLSLHRWLREKFPNLPLAFTGFSLGGAMAASAACALSEGPRVALAPCLSSLTAEAMCDGADQS